MLSQTTPSEFASLLDFMRSSDAMLRSDGNISLGASDLSVLTLRAGELEAATLNDDDMPS